MISAPGPAHPGRLPLVAAALLYLLALMPRLAYQAELAGSPFWSHPVLDEAVNDRWARRMAAGEPDPAEPYFRAPLYPWLMGGIYRLAGPHPGNVRVTQALLSALACVLVAAIARRAFGAAAGWAGGVLAAVYWPWIYFDGELQDVSLSLFLDLGALACLLRGLGARRSLAWTLAGGACLGLSAITRPTVLAAVPALAAWSAWTAVHRRPRGSPGSWRAAVPAVGVLLAGVLAPVLPVTARNLWQGGDLVLVASQGGMNFYIGNHPGSDGYSARFPGSSGEWEAMVEEARRQAEGAAGRPLRPSEVSRHWFRAGIRFWRQQPASALRLTLRKVALLLGRPELPNNKQIRTVTAAYSRLLAAPLPGFGLALPLAVVGLLWGRGGPRAGLLAAFAASYGVAVVLFFVNARFRMPLAAVLLPLAAGGLVALARLLRRGPRPRAAAALATLVAVGLPVNAARYRENTAHARYTLGNAWEAAGDLPQAEREFRGALGEDPALRAARLALSTLLLGQGRAAEAERLLRDAPDPSAPPLRHNLAAALLSQGRPGEAVELLEDLVREHPDAAENWVRLGNARLADGDASGAGSAFRRAREIDPSRPEPAFNLANLRLAAGDLDGAEEAYRALLAAHPDHAGGWNNLGIVLVRRGRVAAGADVFRRALALDPGNAEAAANLRAAEAGADR